MAESALCDICADRFLDNLRDIAEMWDDLELRLLTEGSGWGNERVGGSRDHGMVINEPVITLRRDITAWTWFLARVVIDERNSAGPDDTGVPGLLKWMADWHGFWLVRHPDNGLLESIAVELDGFQRQARRRAYPGNAKKVDLPNTHCKVIVDVDSEEPRHCDGTLFAIVSEAASCNPDLVCSENEEHRIKPADWQHRKPLRAIDSTQGMSWLSATEAAALLQVTRATVYVLAKTHGWGRRQDGIHKKYAEQDVRAYQAQRGQGSRAALATA